MHDGGSRMRRMQFEFSLCKMSLVANSVSCILHISKRPCSFSKSEIFLSASRESPGLVAKCVPPVVHHYYVNGSMAGSEPLMDAHQ